MSSRKSTEVCVWLDHAPELPCELLLLPLIHASDWVLADCKQTHVSLPRLQSSLPQWTNFRAIAACIQSRPSRIGEPDETLKYLRLAFSKDIKRRREAQRQRQGDRERKKLQQCVQQPEHDLSKQVTMCGIMLGGRAHWCRASGGRGRPGRRGPSAACSPAAPPRGWCR